jgi:hypothetical protein
MPTPPRGTFKKPWACHENASPCHDAASVHASRAGAALIVVIAIMTILLAIGLTFFAVSRIEVRTATNVSNTVRTELLGDAAVAIAVAALNQDLIDNPTTTSLDHPWRSIFSGAWAAGKPWAWKNPASGGLAKGQPIQVDMNDFVFLNALFEDGTTEPLYQGPRTRSWLYIPRVEFDQSNPNQPVLVLYDESVKLQLSATAPRGSLTGDGDTTFYTFAPYAGVSHPRDILQYRIYNFTMNDNLASASDRLVGPGDIPFVTSSFYGTASDRSGNPLGNAFGFIRSGDDADLLNYPIEQVAMFSDVDNNSDGHNDSIWLPLQEDEFFPADGIDNDLDGLLDETQDNGIDEDADGLIDQIVNISSVTSDPDEGIEGAPFVYHGLGPFVEGRRIGDGLDNDGNGVVDDIPGEDKYFLTSPLPGIEVYVDLDGDGQAYDLVPLFPGDPEFNTSLPQPQTAPLRMRLPERVNVLVTNPVTGDRTVITLGAEDVDVLDNDYDLLANDFATYAYVGPNPGFVAPFTFNNFTYNAATGWSRNTPLPGTNSRGSTQEERSLYTAWLYEDNGDPARWQHPGNWVDADKDLYAGQRKRGFNDINRALTFGISGDPNALGRFVQQGWIQNLLSPDDQTILNAAVRITHSGEPVCKLIGRAAVQIADVSGSVNVNTAGAMSYRPDYDLNAFPPTGPLQIASKTGATTGEYDLRMVPQLGISRIAKLWGLRTGADGSPILPVTDQDLADGWIDPVNPGNFGYDISLPGYGRIDDNLDALLLGTNGIDDDGDGLIDEGTRVPGPNDPDYPLLPLYLAQLGVLEGTDEPGELQRFNPLRNLVAESNVDASDAPLDDDGDGFANEIGELGDRMLLSRNEVQQAFVNEAVVRNDGPRLANVLTTHSTDRSVAFIETEDGLKTLRKVDYALATPQQIAEALIIHGGQEGVTRRTGNFGRFDVRNFSDGLRQSEVHLRSTIQAGGEPTPLVDIWGSNDIPRQRYLSSGFGGILFARMGDPEFFADPLIPGSDDIPVDPILRSMQIAVNLVDARDRDYTRATLTLDEEADNLFAPADERLSLSRLETRYDEEIGGIRPDLKIDDRWWADLVTSGTPDPERPGVLDVDERYISYTTTGTEAVRINELMVRPVRRVEVESQRVRTGFTAPGELSARVGSLLPLDSPSKLWEAEQIIEEIFNAPEVFLGGSTLFDPSPYSSRRDPATLEVVRGMPQFDVGVSTLAENLGGVPPASSAAAWTTQGASLGEFAVVNTAARYIETVNSDNPVPNVIQFKFRSTDGLPSGRYYLTINTGAPGFNKLIDPASLEYSIKYTQSQIELSDESVTSLVPDILTDVQNVLTAAAVLNGDDTDDDFNLVEDYFEAFWAPVQDGYFGRTTGYQKPSLAPLDQTSASGCLFLPGQPETPLLRELPGVLGLDVLNPNALSYFTDGLGRSFGIAPSAPVSSTFTVEVPPAPTPDGINETTATYLELCIALRIPPAPDDSTGPLPEPLNINFFEFSQEPDHEYVELVNISDEVVDISGWELEIGPPRDRVLNDPFRETFRVPDGTFIGPEGMVLLTTAKFDFFESPPTDILSPEVSLYDAPQLLGMSAPLELLDFNGIGLARGYLQDDLANFALPSFDEGALLNVTVPPFSGPAIPNPAGRPHPLEGGFLSTASTTAPMPYEPTGSVFDRSALLPGREVGSRIYTFGWDLVDYDGDGLTWRLSDETLSNDFDNSQLRWIRDDNRDVNGDGLITIGTDVTLTENAVNSSFVLAFDTEPQSGTNPYVGVTAKAWDRIIQLDGVLRSNTNDVAALAQLLSRGGMLPNYPEQDDIDNDGDTTILTSDGVNNNQDPLGLIDEPTEGIDEGRLVAAGSYGAGTLRVSFIRDAAAYGLIRQAFIDNPADPLNSVSNSTLEGIGYAGLLANLIAAGMASAIDGIPEAVLASYGLQGFSGGALTYGGGLAFDASLLASLDENYAPYLGSDADPPDWKAFVERRWYPGDNVVVTLYEGRAVDDRIADRVTYSQADVENRTIDDIQESPYGEYLHSTLYPTWWVPNHMGLDFYKSLERKSPYMMGDRHGTSNRWEATDGNYDDWAQSPSYFLNRAVYPYVNSDLDRAHLPVLDIAALDRYSTNAFPASGGRQYAALLFDHAMDGSPLRHNLTYRVMTNPTTSDAGIIDPSLFVETNPRKPDAQRMRQFIAADIFDISYPDKPGTYPPISSFLKNKDFNAEFALVKNRGLVSLGEILQVPLEQYEHYLYNTASPNFQVEAATNLTWLHDMNSVNRLYRLEGRYTFADIALRGATLGQGNTDAETPNPLNAVADVTTSNPLTLTVGTASVTPGYAVIGTPDGRDEGALGRIRPQEQGALTTWDTESSSGTIIRGPGVWLPVLSYLFDDDFDEPAEIQGDLYYDRLNNGSFGGIPVEDRYAALFRGETLLNDPLFAGAGLELSKEYVELRQPYTSRALMYVAQINDQIIDPATGLPVAPRALFEWGPEDGLEGGTYDLYVGTYIPGLVDRLTSLLPGPLNAAASIIGASVDPLLDDRLLNPAALIAELPDPLSRRSRDAGFCVGAECPDYMLRTAVATTRLDRTRLLGIGVGGQNFGLLTEVHPRSDGYAYLGTVNIKDDENYLALFVELPTQGIQVPKRLNMLTHVVLAPRDRTPGKVNINTAEVRARQHDAAVPANQEQLFTALMGLPGMIPPGVSREEPIAAPNTGLGSLSDVAATQTPWTAPSAIHLATQLPVSYPPFVNDDFIDGSFGQQAAQLASLTTIGRTEHPDGRYYERITDLALEDSAFNFAPNDGVAVPVEQSLYPLTVSGDAEARFADVLERYPAISNLITTRSDVFEIIATVQAGYGLDEDGDGFINYRSNEEFVTTAESKVRTVYERRVPEPGE